jgi:hypothetical protein
MLFVIFYCVKPVINFQSIHTPGDCLRNSIETWVHELDTKTIESVQKLTVHFLTYVINNVLRFHCKILVSVCCAQWPKVLPVTEQIARNVWGSHVWNSYWILGGYECHTDFADAHNDYKGPDVGHLASKSTSMKWDI